MRKMEPPPNIACQSDSVKTYPIPGMTSDALYAAVRIFRTASDAIFKKVTSEGDLGGWRVWNNGITGVGRSAKNTCLAPADAFHRVVDAWITEDCSYTSELVDVDRLCHVDTPPKGDVASYTFTEGMFKGQTVTHRDLTRILATLPDVPELSFKAKIPIVGRIWKGEEESEIAKIKALRKEVEGALKKMKPPKQIAEEQAALREIFLKAREDLKSADFHNYLEPVEPLLRNLDKMSTAYKETVLANYQYVNQNTNMRSRNLAIMDIVRFAAPANKYVAGQAPQPMACEDMSKLGSREFVRVLQIGYGIDYARRLIDDLKNTIEAKMAADPRLLKSVNDYFEAVVKRNRPARYPALNLTEAETKNAKDANGMFLWVADRLSEINRDALTPKEQDFITAMEAYMVSNRVLLDLIIKPPAPGGRRRRDPGEPRPTPRPTQPKPEPTPPPAPKKMMGLPRVWGSTKQD